MKTRGASLATRRPRSATHSAARVLPLVGAAAILVAITLDVDPIHDIDLFVFEGAWVALGVALLRPSTDSAGDRVHSGLMARPGCRATYGRLG